MIEVGRDGFGKGTGADQGGLNERCIVGEVHMRWIRFSLISCSICIDA